MCHEDPTRTREVIEVLEEVIPMPPGEVEVVVVDTQTGGMNLMIIQVETVTKGATTTTEEGDVVVVVEEMAIRTTTTTKTLMLVLRLSFTVSLWLLSASLYVFRYNSYISRSRVWNFNQMALFCYV